MAQKVQEKSTLEIITDLIIKIGLGFSLVLTLFFIAFELRSLIVDKLLISLVTVFVLFLLLVVFTKYLSIKKQYLMVLFFLILGLLLRLYVVYHFRTPLSVESFYTFEYAKHWLINGPAKTSHAIIFNSWGIYALLLTVLMRIFGTSGEVVKNIGIFFTLFSGVFILFLASKLNKKVLAIGSLIIFLYPATLLYVNFPGCDLIFFGLVGLVLVSLFYLEKKIEDKSFLLYVVFFSLSLSIASIFKEALIITYPLSVLVLCYGLIKRNKDKLLISFVVLSLVTFLAPLPAYKILEKYAQGPINKNKMGYYLATGLNYSTDGLFVHKYYYPMFEQLTQKLEEGKLSKDDYLNFNKYFYQEALVKLEEPRKIAKLIIKKNKHIWENDKLINEMTFYDKSLYGNKPTSHKYLSDKYITPISTGFLIFINIFYFLNIIGTIKSTNKSIYNLYAIFFTALFSLSLFIIEGQPRYRIIVMPTLLFGSIQGMMYFEKIFNARVKQEKNEKVIDHNTSL